MNRKSLYNQYGVKILKRVSKYGDVYIIDGVFKEFDNLKQVHAFLEENKHRFRKSSVAHDYKRDKEKIIKHKRMQLTKFYDVAVKHMQPYYTSHTFYCPICLGRATVYSDNTKMWAKCGDCKIEAQTSSKG